MNKETAIGTLQRVIDVLQKSGQDDVRTATDRAVRSVARSCGILISKAKNARVYPDGYLSMSSIGIALGCPFPQWRNVQRALVQMGYLKKERGEPQPTLTHEGKQWGRIHEEDGKRWRVWHPGIVENIRELVSRYNEAAFEDAGE